MAGRASMMERVTDCELRTCSPASKARPLDGAAARFLPRRIPKGGARSSATSHGDSHRVRALLQPNRGSCAARRMRRAPPVRHSAALRRFPKPRSLIAPRKALRDRAERASSVTPKFRRDAASENSELVITRGIVHAAWNRGRISSWLWAYPCLHAGRSGMWK
jgi:hypothetical protein